MTPDINLKSYYLQYIRNVKADIVKYNDDLAATKKIKEELYNYLESYINKINDTYSINLLSYNKEWIDKQYNTSETLYNKLIRLLNNIDEDDNRIVLIQLVKYCNILRAENKYNQLILIADNRKTINFTTYSKYVVNYYSKVHKAVLEGFGYRFSHGIGTYCINHWKIDPNLKNKTKRIDFAATAARKKQLIESGAKIYDDKQAAWYAARNIPYDGVDYRIYKNESSFYEFTFIKSKLFNNTTFDYKRTEYVSVKYRTMSYTQMADKLCADIEQVYTLQVDIKYKLNIILYKEPNRYLKFIRNAEQCKYKRGAHNS